MTSTEKKWKTCQQLYATIMRNRHTDVLDDSLTVHEKTTSVARALEYTTVKSFPVYQPTKDFVVAIAYAYLIAEHYKEDFLTALSDPELFLEPSEYFVPYFEAMDEYDRLILNLGPFDEWRHTGWMEATCKYFWLECTEEGVEFVSSSTDEEIAKYLGDSIKETIHG